VNLFTLKNFVSSKIL